MPRWVEGESYVGVDRRKGRAKLRYAERRQAEPAPEAPSLGAALRQLQVRAANTHKPGGVSTFVDRARAIAGLAESVGETGLARELLRLADLVAAQPNLDWRAQLETALGTISERLAAK